MSKVPTRHKEAKVPFYPRFTNAFEGHAHNVVRKMYPRLMLEHEFDDLLQEAWVVFLHCRSRYAGKVDNPAWFMALFSRALHNRFIDLQRHLFAYIPIDELSDDDEPMTNIDAGYCWRVLQELPGDMRELLQVLGLGDVTVLPALQKRLRELTASGDVQPTQLPR